MIDKIKQRLTDNATDFDGIVFDLLAEIERLNVENSRLQDDFTRSVGICTRLTMELATH